MALYIPHIIFHLARLLYVRPETFGPYYVDNVIHMTLHSLFLGIFEIVCSVIMKYTLLW